MMVQHGQPFVQPQVPGISIQMMATTQINTDQNVPGAGPSQNDSAASAEAIKAAFAAQVSVKDKTDESTTGKYHTTKSLQKLCKYNEYSSKQ